MPFNWKNDGRYIREWRRNIFVYDGAEQFRPHGNYSMAAIISADKESDPDDDLDEDDEYPGEDIDGPN